MLPGGRALLFKVEYGRGADQIAVQSLETGERRQLMEGSSPRYAPTGHVVFARGSSLWAVPFDVERLAVVGSAVPVVENVDIGRRYAQFALASNGTLVYAPRRVTGGRTLVWVDRDGREETVSAEPRLYNAPRLSLDGTRVAVTVEEVGSSNTEIWVHDLARHTETQLTFDPGVDTYPIWTPDGQRVVFSSGREGVRNLFWRPADGTGQDERLTTSPNIQSPWAWSRDGKTLVFQEQRPETSWDVSVLSMDGTRQADPPSSIPPAFTSAALGCGEPTTSSLSIGSSAV